MIRRVFPLVEIRRIELHIYTTYSSIVLDIYIMLYIYIYIYIYINIDKFKCISSLNI